MFIRTAGMGTQVNAITALFAKPNTEFLKSFVFSDPQRHFCVEAKTQTEKKGFSDIYRYTVCGWGCSVQDENVIFSAP